MLSISRDKFLVYHCTESGRRLGGHQCSAGCTSIEYDHLSNHVFVGDYTGQILMIKLEENCYQVITTLKVVLKSNFILYRIGVTACSII